MQIKTQELKKALEIVKPGLATKELIEQTSSFAFLEDRVVTYNDEISISHPIALGFIGAVQAETLYGLLSKIKKEDISLEVSETELIIDTGRTKAGMALTAEIKLPIDEVKQVKKWLTLPETLFSHVSSASACCSRDMSRPLLTAIHISKEGFIEASDGYRIYRASVPGIPKTFVIPASSLLAASRLKPVEFEVTDGWVHFRTKEKTVISCRIYRESYPDCTPHLANKGTSITFPKGITEALERAEVFSKKQHWVDEIVNIVIKDNKLVLSSKKDTDWFEETLNMKCPTSLQFGASPTLLKDMLSKVQDAVVSSSKIRFEGSDWQYIAMLKG